MSRLRAQRWLLACLCSIGSSAGATASLAVSPELQDLEARIEYGFQVEQATIVEAAVERLEQMSEDDAVTQYLQAFGSYRLALTIASSNSARAQTYFARCAELAGRLETALPGEALVLEAACSVGAATSTGAGLSSRKAEQWLARSRASAAEDPRLSLVEAQARLARSRDEGALAFAVARLEAAVEVYQATSTEGLRWGEAEALATLAACYLEQNKVQAARDMIERALLAAPGYRYATRLQERLISQH